MEPGRDTKTDRQTDGQNYESSELDGSHVECHYWEGVDPRLEEVVFLVF